MTPTDWGTPKDNAYARQGKLVLGGLVAFAVAIVVAMIGFIVHEWRLPGEAVSAQSQLERAVKTLQAGNNQAALTAFGKIAEEGNPAAQYWLGHMTELGLGVARDPRKAIELYKKAAAQDVTAAESRLGEAYLRGNIVPPDYTQAK